MANTQERRSNAEHDTTTMTHGNPPSWPEVASHLGRTVLQHLLSLAWLLTGVALTLFLRERDLACCPAPPSSNPVSPIITTSKPSPSLPPHAPTAVQFRVVVPDEKHPDKNIRRLPADLSSWPPGEMGLGVELNEDEMPPEEAKRKRVPYRHQLSTN